MINTQTYPDRIDLRFSVEEYYKMIKLGLLKDYEKTEIIDGRLMEKIRVENMHAFAVNILNRFFIKSVSDDIRVGVQNPLRISDYNELEPDIVLSDLTKYDGKRHPRPAETLLVVEVSDSTLKYDRDVKLALYAEAEIPEVWIVNLPNNIVEVHQKPSNGIYQLTNIFKPGEILTSEILPDLKLEVSKILE